MPNNTYTTPKSNRSHMQIKAPKSRDTSKDAKDNKKKNNNMNQNPQKPAQAKGKSNEVQIIPDSNQFEIKTQWEKVYKIGSGFQNVGNTCFLNSVLQMLAYTPPFANYLLNGVHSSKCRKQNGSQFCALCAFERIAKRAFSGKPVIEPSEILRNVKQINKKFRIGRQEDSQEFLRDLIDAFQKSATGFIEKPSQQVLENTDISKIFKGKLKSCVECKQCHYKSEIFENFFDLSLELNKSESIEKCLQVFFRAEELKGANKYRCSGCNKLVDATKKFSIHQRPVVLTIHLKRFDNVFMRISKINRHIDFPETLSLKPYVSEPTSEPLIYDLHGMVIHMGSGCSCGHYFSYVKNSNGSWYLMNDEDVRPSNIDKVLKQNAYLLTYVLRGGVKKSEKAMEEETPVEEPKKKTEMEIEKPKLAQERKREKSLNMKQNGKIEEEKQEKSEKIPLKTPSPVPELKFIKLFNANEDEKVKNQATPTEKIQVEKEAKKPEIKTQAPKESKMEVEKKSQAKPSLNKLEETPEKPQEALPTEEPALEQQKSLSDKIFESLSQPVLKATPSATLFTGTLDDSLDAPSNKKRMEFLPSFPKNVSIDSLIKEKAEKVVNLIRKPSIQKIEKRNSLMEEEEVRTDKPVKKSVKIEAPQLIDNEKIPYSKQLESLLDEREAKVYMDKLEKSPFNKRSLKRSLSMGETKVQTPAKVDMLPEITLLKSLSFTKQLSRSFSLTTTSPLKVSPLMKLKRMSKAISLIPEKKIKRQESIQSVTSTASTSQQSVAMKPQFKNLQSFENRIQNQAKAEINKTNNFVNKFLPKIQEVEEWKRAENKEVKKIKKELNGVSKVEKINGLNGNYHQGKQQQQQQKQQQNLKKIKVSDYPKAVNHVLNR